MDALPRRRLERRVLDLEPHLRTRGLTLPMLARYGEHVADSKLAIRRHVVPKRGGGTRTLYIPNPELDTILKLLKRALDGSELYAPPPCVHGYVPGKSIVTNASQHLGAPVVLAIDLQDYFESIDQEGIQDSLRDAGLPGDQATTLSAILAPEGMLPPGFATSPMISNLVFDPTDGELLRLAEEEQVAYSRYADDLVFSGTPDDALLHSISDILAQRGWAINHKKTRFMRRGGPQYVTGLFVGDPRRPRIPRSRKRWVQQELHYMKEYGVESCYKRGHGMHERQARGWVRYIAQLEPIWGPRLRVLLEQIDFSNDYLYWSDPGDWPEILDDIGL